MAEIVRGKTHQKGCHVCGKPIVKIGENALVVKDSDGNIAFCSQECADKYNPEIDLGSSKKKSKKSKIDALMMAAPKAGEEKVEPKPKKPAAKKTPAKKTTSKAAPKKPAKKSVAKKTTPKKKK